MRDWDGTNRQCAEGRDSRQREGNGYQGAAKRHPVEQHSAKYIHGDDGDPGQKMPGRAAAEPEVRAGHGSNRTFRHTVVTAGKKLVARSERRGFSSRLVNEFAQEFCICPVWRHGLEICGCGGEMAGDRW
jgi:hypothetical protein